MGYLYIASTIVFTVYGQLIMKWRIADYGNLPEGFFHKITFLLSLLLDPFILSGFISAFLAALSWMAAMTKFDRSFAYPFMSLNFVLVFFLSIFVLNEVFTIGKVIGLIFIILGIIITVKF